MCVQPICTYSYLHNVELSCKQLTCDLQANLIPLFGILVNQGLLTEIFIFLQLLLIILGLLGKEKINEQCRQPIKVIVNLPSPFSTVSHPTSLLPSGCIMSYDQHNGIKLNQSNVVSLSVQIDLQALLWTINIAVSIKTSFSLCLSLCACTPPTSSPLSFSLLLHFVRSLTGLLINKVHQWWLPSFVFLSWVLPYCTCSGNRKWH